MPARTLPTGIARRRSIGPRLERVCTSERLVLMVVTTQPSREDAARVSGRHTSQGCTRLQSPAKVAISTGESLAKTPATPCAKPLHDVQGLPWNMALLLERTRPRRARLPPANATPCTHGQGAVIAPQWPKSVLSRPDLLMPRRPSPDYRPQSCLEPALTEPPAPERVVDDLST